MARSRAARHHIRRDARVWAQPKWISIALVAQQAEQPPCKRQAARSNRRRGHHQTSRVRLDGRGHQSFKVHARVRIPHGAPGRFAEIAHQVERRPPKPKVRGSTPWSGAIPSRRSQVVEGDGLQSRRRKPASVRIGSSSPCLVSSADQSSRLLPGGSAVRIGHEAPVHFPDSADGRAPGC